VGSARRKASTYTQNNRNTEPTFPAFERAKSVHALDLAATVIGTFHKYVYYNSRRSRLEHTKPSPLEP
jgi:hypothetical protein